MTRRRDQRGAATVLAVALLGLLVLLGCALSVVGAMFAAHRSAQAAADLSALAGAEAVAGQRDPCVVATQTATANGATLTACVVEGRDVRVIVRVAWPRWRGLASGDLSAESRAGPSQ